MNRLTDLKIRNFSAPTEQMLSDGFGLYLKVRPNSTIKAWIVDLHPKLTHLAG